VEGGHTRGLLAEVGEKWREGAGSGWPHIKKKRGVGVQHVQAAVVVVVVGGPVAAPGRGGVGRCHTWFLRPQPDAHCMYAQDQVVIHMVRM
jgi:hypothetical protein